MGLVRCPACDGSGIQVSEPFEFRTVFGVFHGVSWKEIALNMQITFKRASWGARLKYLLHGSHLHGQER